MDEYEALTYAIEQLRLYVPTFRDPSHYSDHKAVRMMNTLKDMQRQAQSDGDH
jgi:hypothetical protein